MHACNNPAGLCRMYHCPAKHGLKKQPALALACGLWEVEPAKGKDWTSEAIHIFAKLVRDVPLQFFVLSYEIVNNITKCQVRHPKFMIYCVEESDIFYKVLVNFCLIYALG